MGQGGSLSQNKSFILSNWVESKPHSNIFYNKVTNQQIQRHEVLINDKHQLQSYTARMHDQSLLVCRLIYFHPKSTPKDYQNHKKPHIKHSSNDPQTDTLRAKSTLKQPPSTINQRSSPKNIFVQTEQLQPKIYCVYTDRMIPVKQWNKDKIIDTIEAFKKLTQLYGYFKVREHCICENQRKQIKIWINENPVSNFIVEYVESEEDMIADLAAILVSKKEKIAKQLLDLQYFHQTIEHFNKLSDFDHKKYLTSTPSHPHYRTTGFPASNRQSETSQPSFLPSEPNNFYNVFINTENSYTVNSSLQNSKYNAANKGTYGQAYYPQKTQNYVGMGKDETKEQGSKKEENVHAKKEIQKSSNGTIQFKTQSEIKVKRQFSPTQQGFLGINLTLAPSPSNFQIKPEQKDSTKSINQLSFQSTSLNNATHSTILTKNSRTKPAEGGQKQPNAYNFGEKDLTENTSIMINAKKEGTLLKNGSLDKEKDRQNANREEIFKQKYVINSEKKAPQSSHGQTSNMYQTHNPKSTVVPKFIPSSTHHETNHRSKNNPSETINRGNLSGDSNFIFDSFGGIKKDHNFNHSAIDSTKTVELPKDYPSNPKLEKPGSATKSHLNSQNYAYIKPVSKNKQKNPEYTKSLGEQASKREGLSESDPKTFIKTDFGYNQSARSKSKVFIKSNNTQNQSESNQNSESARNVVSQMSSLNPNNQIPTLLNTLSKKSFPKYFAEKQTAKSIQKYYEKSLEERQKSQKVLVKVEDKLSPQKFAQGPIINDPIKCHQNSRIQEVVVEVSDSEAYSQEVIPASNWQESEHTISHSHLRTPVEINSEPRRKFPSTIEGKPRKLLEAKHLEEMECKKSKPGTENDSQQSHEHSKLSAPSHIIAKPNQLKKPNSLGAEEAENKSCIMTKSHFSQVNTNNSVLVGNTHQFKNKMYATDCKKKTFEAVSKDYDHTQEKVRFKDVDRSEYENEVKSHGNQSSGGPFMKLEEKLSLNQESKSRDSMVEFQEMSGRNQSFPYPPGSLARKIDKQFTFFSSNQKPTGVGNIEQIHPYEPPVSKGKTYFKKESMKSVDEQETLPRTTADEREKRLFKQTRMSEVLIDASDLHKSDPGHKIEQLVEKIEKQKEALMKKNAQQIIDEKLDVKQYPVFKKWEPSMNVFGSLINHQSTGSKKKDYAKSQQDGTADDKLSVTDDQKDDRAKGLPEMANSQNLQSKKKIRKEVFMDYKGLFGDENPFKEESAEEKERAKKLEIKRQREQEERLLENASSKDLLIQEKVQKQKEKHAELKSDLSKLFIEEV